MDDAKTFKTDAIHEENPLIQDRTVIAVFADSTTADAARDALRTVGYKHVDVTTADPADAGKPVHQHGFWDSFKTMFGGHRDTSQYGEAVRSGQSLVVVHTEQGRAANAIDILDSFSPVDLKGGEQAWIDTTASLLQANRVERVETVPTPETLAVGDEGSVLEEEMLIVETDPCLGNERVRSYSRNLPVVVAEADGGALVAEGEVIAEPVKRAD